MKKSFTGFVALALVTLFAGVSHAALEADKQKKLDEAVEQVKKWAADPAVVKATEAANAAPSAEVKAMTQDKWKTLPVLDPFVRSFNKNDAATKLKALKSDAVAEAFLSSADGKKVAFLAKTTGWSHAGKPKHDQPMANAVWQGDVEVDDSTGQQQVQVAVPVLDAAGKPIGSLVVGFSLGKL